MRFLMLLIVACIHTVAFAAELTVQVDRNTLYEDESLEMQVELHDGSGAGSFDPVLSDFDILQRSEGTQMQYINGKRSSSHSWMFLLAPKRTGALTIPAFDIGGARSEAQSIKVEGMASRAQTAEVRPFFLRVSVSEKSPFVQQQTIYTMKLYQQQPIAGGSVSEPDHPDIHIERLGLDRSYQEQVDGHEYSVLERSYALFPQRSGELVLPAINLMARVPVRTRSDGFFAQNTRSIRVRSQSVTLDVRSAADTYTAAWWLPSTRVTGEAKWQSADAQQGQPLSLAIQITAEGVIPSQLPQTDDPKVEGARLYSDGSREGKTVGVDGVMSRRVSQWTIIPTRLGELSIAPFKLSWWDLNTQTQKTLEITVPVLPVAAAAAGDVAEAVEQQQAKISERPVVSQEEGESSPEAARATGEWVIGWRTQVVLFSLIAFATLLIRRRRRLPLPLAEERCSPEAAEVRLVEAVSHKDTSAAQEAVLDWASGVFNQEIRSLPYLAKRLNDPVFSRLVLELDAICYRDQGTWAGEALLEKLKQYELPQDKVAVRDRLPALS